MNTSPSTTAAIAGRNILVIGGGNNLGSALASALEEAGANVTIGVRTTDASRTISTASGQVIDFDIANEASIEAASTALGAIDHIVSTASSPHNVGVADLHRDAIVSALDAKVIGPMLVAKYFARLMPPDGSLTFFSGVAAWSPSPSRVVMGVTNGAVDFLVRHLAVELAPVRVNAISPGIVDSGAWDRLGDDARAAFLAKAASGTLVGRHGLSQDIVDATLWLMGAGFVSGETIHVEGGARRA